MGKAADRQPRSRKPASAQEQASRAAMNARKQADKQRQAAEAAASGRARMAAALLGAQQHACTDAPAPAGEVAYDQAIAADDARGSNAPQNGAAAAPRAPPSSGVPACHESVQQ